MTETPPPALRSAIDVYLSERISGWAWNPKHPTYSPTLDFEVNGAIVAQVRCDRLRPDLREQGIGSGACGFDFNPRPHLGPGRNACRLIVGRSGARLPGSEQIITIPEPPPAGAPPSGAPILRPDRVWSQRTDPAWFRPGDIPPPTHAQIIGLFNGGTSYGHDLTARNGIAMTGPATEMLFFKHYPPAILTALAAAIDPAQHARTLFVMMTRNPYDWIASMRRVPYGASFRGLDGPFSIDLSTTNHDVITYGEHIGQHLDGTAWHAHFTARNIVQFWNTYHADALAAADRLAHVAVLPYEDAVLHPAETLVLLSTLLTLPQRQALTITLGSAKPGHPWSGGYLDAKRKAARPVPPANLSADEIRVISDSLRADLCDRLGYAVW